MNTIKELARTIIVIMILVAGVSLVSAWTAPTQAPPGGNVSAPVNVGALSQIKSGPLQVNGFRNIGNSIFDGSVGIGIVAPEAKLHVAGTGRFNSPLYATDFIGTLPTSFIRGGTFCISNDCRSAWPGGGGGGGIAGGGTVNYLSKFTDTGTIGNSTIFDNGSVGIGTATPLDRFHVAGGKIRGEFNCRAIDNTGVAPNYISKASCGGDEWLLGGGGECEIPGKAICGGISKGVLHTNRPDGNSWVVDCYKNDWSGEACSKAYAICCKK